jgi:excisionase family DNA binding protein
MKTPDEPKGDRHSDGLVTANEIARRYRVTPRYILKLAANGDIPCVRIGIRRVVRFDTAAVVKVLEGGGE